jgi:hypothetical protein
LWIFFVAKMPEYDRCCGKFDWRSGDLPEDWKSAMSPSSEEMSRTSHLMAQCGPLYHRVTFFCNASAMY